MNRLAICDKVETTTNTLTFLTSFLFPLHIENVHSSINGDIFVEYASGAYRVTVDGYWQSGRYSQDVFKKALDGICIDISSVRSVLILGLGSGSIVEIIRKCMPGARIIGVDIDLEMIHLGKKYFHLSKNYYLDIVVEDAYKYMEELNKDVRFNMIISDLYIGCKTPYNLRSDRFISLTFDHLSIGGVYVSNCSYIPKYKKQTDIFLSKIKRKFQLVESVIRKPNNIIRAYKK